MVQQINRFRSKKELAYEYLRQAIIQAELLPGTRLVIDELSEQLGISQIPIREAMQQLQADGFVEIRPHVGVTVTEIHSERIDEIFSLLEATEVISSRAACHHMSDADMQELEALLREMDAAMDDFDRWSAGNLEMHYLICDRGRTPLVKSVMTKVLDQWNRLRNLYLKNVFTKRIHEAQADHWAIFSAIQARDPEQVEQLIRAHNRKAKLAYAAYLNGH